MVNLATIVQNSVACGKIYHIIYEIAAFDLNEFLTMNSTERHERRDKRHESASPSRTNSANMWAGDLILESRNLADALDYLHNRLHNMSKISLAHNDLKPENILVFYPDSIDIGDRYPVGQWKIADFGLSKVKDKRVLDNKLLSAEDAIPIPRKADITHRIERSLSVSRTVPKRDPGKYTAPELDQKKLEKTDGRSADIWSFGCVLSEVVAFAVKLDSQPVSDLRNALYKPNYADQRFYDIDTKEVKCSFLDYLNKLPDLVIDDGIVLDAKGWIFSSIALVKEIVVTDPSDRLGADKIRDRLREIGFCMRETRTQKLWLDTSAHPDMDVADTTQSYSPGVANPSATESPTAMENLKSRTDGTSWAIDTAPTIVLHPAKHSAPVTNKTVDVEDRKRRQTAPR